MNKTILEINNKLFYTLYDAVWNDNIKTVKKCINLKACLDGHNNYEWGETPLHCAAKWNRTKIAILLLDAGANIESRDKGQSTPLHTAINYMHFEVVKLFIERKAEVNARDKNNQSPLHYLISPPAAYFEECVKLRNLLIKSNADIHAENIYGETYAKDNKDPAMTEFEITIIR
jgi:ankyrin repeat protein